MRALLMPPRSSGSSPAASRGPSRSLLTLGLLGLLAGSGALAGCWPTETPTTDSGQVDLDGDGTADGDGEDAASDGAASGSRGTAGSEGSGSTGDLLDPDGDDAEGGADGGSTDGAASAGGSTSGSDGSSTAGNRATSGSTTSGNRATSGSTSGNRSGSGSASSGSTSGNRSSSGSASSGSTSGNRGSSGSTSSGRTSGNRTSSGSTGDSTSSGSSNRLAGSGSTDTGGRTSSGNRTSSGSSTDAATATGGNRTASGSAGDDDNDGISMGMDMPAVDDWETAPGVRRFSGEDWQSLREERVITVMNEPGPGTDPGCYPRDVMPMAEKGKLTKDQVSCVQASLSQAEYDADKARLSLVLITNAHARMETDNWEWLVARHLETIDPENPGLSYRYALHLYEAGPEKYTEAYRWAGVALGQRAAWTGSVYHERVTRLYKLRSALSQAQWRSAEERFAADPSEDNRDTVLEWREATRKSALEWYRYAKETEMDTTVAYKLCSIASIQEGCEGVDAPG